MRTIRLAMGGTALLAMVACGDANTVTGVDTRDKPATPVTPPPVTVTRVTVTPPPAKTRTPPEDPCVHGAHDCAP